MGKLSPHRGVRNYENLQKRIFDGVGSYDIPILEPVTDIEAEKWIEFSAAKGNKEPDKTIVHFFIDDFQFERVWQFTDAYTNMLARFRAVCTPDFSPYADFPHAIQIYNHYRKHWCGAYWQEHGLKVIPTITWSSPDTLEWCFDGEPVGGVVAISSVGMFDTKEHFDWLMIGYEEMIERLRPTKVFWKGKVPEELRAELDGGMIVPIPSHVDKWRK